MTPLQIALKLTLQFEGGKVNNPKDPGGKTNYGITQNTYNSWLRGQHKVWRDVYYISMAEVEEIYKTRYWDKAGCDKFALPLAVARFDTAVNYGTASSILRSSPASMATRSWIEQKREAIALCDRRIRQRYASRNYSTFGKGWLRRDHALKAYIIGIKGS